MKAPTVTAFCLALACMGCSTSDFQRPAPEWADARPIVAKFYRYEGGQCLVILPLRFGGSITFFEGTTDRCQHLSEQGVKP